jgi:hypothetical protein
MSVSVEAVRIRGNLVRVGYIDGEGYQFVDDPNAMLQALAELGRRVDIFTFVQRLSQPKPLFGYPFEMDNIAVLPVTTYDEWLTKKIDFKVRNKVRKSAKHGVVVKEVPFDDELLRGISLIYNETPIRQGRRFWHYQMDMESLRRMKATFLDQSTFIGAFFENNLIGFIKLVSDRDNGQAGLMHIVSMIKHRDKAPTNALIAHAVRSCAERGIPYLWYANLFYGKKQGDSLAEFKRHSGFEKFDIPRYYVPLTIVGRIALRAGLHRGVTQWIPEPAAAVYRRIRSTWYAKKYARPENA